MSLKHKVKFVQPSCDVKLNYADDDCIMQTTW